MPGEIGATLDGITSKPPYTGVVNQVAGVVQGITDQMEEIKVSTTGVPRSMGRLRACAWSSNRA